MKQVDVVGAVIINDNQKILSALRSQQMSLPGMWEFPGGKIEKGEKPQESLIREIEEELGCQIEVGELISDSVYEYPTVKVRLITYFAKVVSGEPMASEHEELRWITANELHSLEWAPADLPTIEKLSKEHILQFR
ncbi:8-oxo-dGTP diphosphatase MutT [Brevibacillus laterosporus]|uniref:8-oxo-dGTP diphosphatase n=1 Tax=Brevibacillus laterosporus LMG 15441 TaxID=1042163 RepID=A0A075RF59_BRELA|nr:8-oxo-dGTP diphosphatase MutT [Brevibacillus laterosporus]AIG27985.1 mutator protein MutT [Brevibacillus laterosporus LMG 15441]MCR8995525.1 8-oxo-dGTP diphosphatase MutT [Brevibacillus laterosporus]RJL09683.1 8-oxo-dGTP diphosphatase MutT [Brevibacillus laterosporus]TPH14100.1 8-oxo-dGTP diphosphatase MutT [Brevibacillus laterosporus]